MYLYLFIIHIEKIKRPKFNTYIYINNPLMEMLTKNKEKNSSGNVLIICHKINLARYTLLCVGLKRDKCETNCSFTIEQQALF